MADKNGVLPYSSIGHCMAKVAAEEGPSALMKGVVPRCLYLGPLAAITLTIYEKVMPECMWRYGASAALPFPVSRSGLVLRGRVFVNDKATVMTSDCGYRWASRSF